ISETEELKPDSGQTLPPPPILLAKFSGKHELKVRFKLNEAISGPKVDLSFQFGSLVAFLTPREFHNMLAVIEAFLEEPISNDQRGVREKMMSSADFRRIESELHRQMNEPTLQNSNLFQSKGWGLAESIEEEIFFPTDIQTHGKSPDLISRLNAGKHVSAPVASTLFQSAFSESTSTSTKPVSDYIVHFKIRLGSLACILLHNDVLSNDSGKAVWSLQSASEMEDLVDSFFSALGPFSLGGKDEKNFTDGNNKLNEACSKSQLRILAAPVTIEGSDQEVNFVRTVEVNFICGNLEALEILQDHQRPIEISRMLTFPSAIAQSGTPNVSVVYKQHLLKQSKTQLRKPSIFPTDIIVTLGSCECEVDISLLDRLNTLIGGFSGKTKHKNDEHSLLSLEIRSSSILMNLRFPIPDLRPVYQRQPWWKRTVRPDIIQFEVNDASMKTSFSNAPQQTYLTTGRTIRVYHKETNFSDPVEILCIFPDKDQVTNVDRLGWPQIKFVGTATEHQGLLEGEESSETVNEELPQNVMTMSFGDALNGMLNGEKDHLNPFETRTRVRNGDGSKNSADFEKILLPSDPSILSKLSDSLSRNSLVHLNIYCPNVVISIESKQIYEMVYNRLATDLALWEPCAPSTKPKTEAVTNQDLGISPFVLCKSGLMASDSDSEGEDSLATWSRAGFNPPVVSQTKFVFSLNICKGSLHLNLPPVDTAASDCGEINVEIFDGWLSSITQANGDPHSGYLLMCAQSGSLRHKAHDERFFREIVSDKDVTSNFFQMSMKLEVEEKTRIKHFKTAIRLQNVDIQFIVAPLEQFWITRIIDFMDVKDTQIQGYKPSIPVTELHLTLDNCDIGYVPLDFPASVLFSIGSFSLTSNIVAHTNTSVLRCVLEDSHVFLSNARHSQLFAQIGDLDFAELCIRICDIKKPRVDLTCSVSKFVLKTCADSSRLLGDLISYVATEGDTIAKQEIASQKSEILSQDVTSLMEDALLESVHTDSVKKDDPVSTHTEVFFFPDESFKSMFKPTNICQAQEAIPIQPSLEDELAEAMGSSPNSVKSSDDFCLVDDVGVASHKNCEPEVTQFQPQRITIKDNHFALPLSVIDFLKAPKNFPLPVTRYTLKEMNLVWCLYRGQDFDGEDTKERKNKGHTVRFADQEPPEVHYTSKVTEENVKFRDEKKKRDTDTSMELHLVKVRFQHEDYPAEELQAGRQVLSISDIEIRDRLPTSTINKFLCRDCSESRPRQANVNMLCVKLLQVRPEVGLSSVEHCLKASILPLRLHIDQDALFFLADFFSGMNNCRENCETEPYEEEATVYPRNRSDSSSSINSVPELQGSNKMFFKSFSFANEVSIRIDYEGKRLEFSRGPLAGILSGLATLNGAEIKLKRLNCRHG
ncbi:hypothetical protein QYM36_014703, partial [Artemia franciscana]